MIFNYSLLRGQYNNKKYYFKYAYYKILIRPRVEPTVPVTFEWNSVYSENQVIFNQKINRFSEQKKNVFKKFTVFRNKPISFRFIFIQKSPAQGIDAEEEYTDHANDGNSEILLFDLFSIMRAQHVLSCHLI